MNSDIIVTPADSQNFRSAVQDIKHYFSRGLCCQPTTITKEHDVRWLMKSCMDLWIYVFHIYAYYTCIQNVLIITSCLFGILAILQSWYPLFTTDSSCHMARTAEMGHNKERVVVR